jgi:predicted metal-binding protein
VFFIVEMREASDRVMTADDLNSLIKDLREVHPDLKPIPSVSIIVSDWVRLKCMYGCKAYGKYFCCPPYAPAPEEMRKILSEYRTAIVVRLEQEIPASGPEDAWAVARRSKGELQQIVSDLEKKAFLSGRRKAFAMGSSPCNLCPTCIAEEIFSQGKTPSLADAALCRHREEVRPSMEACGIDVFGTARNAGFSPHVLKSYSDRFELFGLVLLE